MRAIAYFALILSIAFYGLLIAWLIQLARVGGGITNVPKMLYSLGWEAQAYGLTLVILGTICLCAGATLANQIGKK
jgi:hypothetical protein